MLHRPRKHRPELPPESQATADIVMADVVFNADLQLDNMSGLSGMSTVFTCWVIIHISFSENIDSHSGK